ncbi:MAG TPA: substrate-binding domain-containing protein, partial [Ktedonobacterales bacterium]|nr:substrate-binding domain-containing protein [Ktedonobacterales bacterium]
MERRGRAGMTRLGTLTLLVAALALAACSGDGTANAKGMVSVAYAGSLVNLMEHHLGPAFSQATGYGYQGRGAGSTALANQIKSKLIAPDVFISASEAAYKPLQGAGNGDIVSWYITFAGDSMVIGYNPKSQYAAQFAAAASGTTPWYQ